MQGENTAILDEFKWRLGQAADAARLSQADIAGRLGVKPQRVGNWFQGRNFPRQREAIALAKLLGTTTEWLLQGSGEKSSVAVAEEAAIYGTKVREVPVINWTHAGAAANYEEMPKHFHGTAHTFSRDRRAFGLIIEGDSMEPRFFAGDKVICEPSAEPRNGKPVVAKFANDTVQLRIYQKLPNGNIRLASLRPEIYATEEHERSAFHWIFPVCELVRSV